MPDAGPPVSEPQEVETAQPPRAASRPSVFRDPLVRRMGYLALGLVILFLATVAGALVTGVIGQSGPRTVTEKDLVVTAQAVNEGSKNSKVWGEYIAALIANEQFAKARAVISQGKASVDDSATADFGLAEARLADAQKDSDGAIKAADAAMKQMEEAHERDLAAGGNTAMRAKLDGLPENYFTCVQLKAYIYRDLGKWDEAIKQYDIYLEHTPTAADILIDRANAKIEAGDKSGAEKDFRAALKYVPDDREALQGLDKIGVAHD